MQRWIRAFHVIVGALIALGAAGHSLAGIAPVQAALGTAGVPAATADLIVAVWHFAGLSMVVLGAIVACNGWQRGRAAVPLWPSTLIGAAYAVYGAATVAFIHQPFFWVFVVLGVATLACVFAWRGATPGR